MVSLKYIQQYFKNLKKYLTISVNSEPNPSCFGIKQNFAISKKFATTRPNQTKPNLVRWYHDWKLVAENIVPRRTADQFNYENNPKTNQTEVTGSISVSSSYMSHEPYVTRGVSLDLRSSSVSKKEIFIGFCLLAESQHSTETNKEEEDLRFGFPSQPTKSIVRD